MHSANAETILGFDFGEKRIGVAVGNTVTSQAQALTTLHVESNAARLGAVEILVNSKRNKEKKHKHKISKRE